MNTRCGARKVGQSGLGAFLGGLIVLCGWQAFADASPPMSRQDAEGQIVRYERATVTKVGQKVPSFEVKTLDGKTVSSDQFKGKVVLVHFYTTWCGWCALVEPMVREEVWAKFGSDPKFLMVAISREESPETVRRHHDHKGIPFPVAADPDGSIYAKFAADVIPRDYLIDARGEIIYQWGEQDRSIVEEAFASGRDRVPSGEMLRMKYKLIARMIQHELKETRVSSGQ